MQTNPKYIDAITLLFSCFRYSLAPPLCLSLRECVRVCVNDKRKESDSKKEQKVGAETFQFLIDLVSFAFDV